MGTQQVAVIGAGVISDYHLAGLQAAGATVAMIVSRSVESARRKADEFTGAATGTPAAIATANLADVWESGTIDAAIVATPDATHAAIAIELLEHGIPVMVQKPLAVTTDEAAGMLEAAERSGVPMFTSFMHRYFEEATAVRELVDTGRLGELLQIRIRNATPGAGWASWFYEPGQAGGGALMQLGVHGIDLLRFMFGEIDAVSALSTRRVNERTLDTGEVVSPAFEDLVIANYRLRRGAIVTHEVMYNEVAGTDRFTMEVYGTEGVALLRTTRGRLALFSESTGEWSTPPLEEAPLGLRHHRHFLDMVDGSAPDDGSGADGFAVLAIAEQVYAAARRFDWSDIDVTH